MSLNGLDDAQIVEAYELAISDPAGWFLLKYSSRDEVELFSRGNGGLVEMRTALAGYDETSPLYGCLKYRRRSVVVKFLPHDCSRIIQARVAVHFNAVCERFAPYDTIFEIAMPSELKDSKLSAACSLHAASGSTSSSTSSLRRRRLMEIAEEEEEEQRASKRQSLEAHQDQDRPRSPAAASAAPDPVALNSQLAEHTQFSADSTSEVPTFVGVDDRPASSAKSSDGDSARPDLFGYSSYHHTKPKVKIGPRPSLDVSGRPHTAGNFRPVSAIPAGFKLFGKGGKKTKGAKDGTSAATAASSARDDINLASSAAAIADESLRAQGDPARPATSSGVSVESVSMPAPSKKQAISPEKARLMKAMQLREKKLKMSAVAAPPSDDAAAPKANEPSAEASESENKVQEGQEQPQAECDAEHDPIKTDTSVVVGGAPSPAHTDQTSDLTQSDSRPASPVVASSEADRSTKASSLSESTDETVQAKDEGPEPDREPEPLSEAENDDEQRAGETATLASEQKTEGGPSRGLSHTPALEARNVQDNPLAEPELVAKDEAPSDLTAAASELSSALEADVDAKSNTQNHVASSSSSSSPPTVGPSVSVNPETSRIPATTPVEAATDTDEALASHQPKAVDPADAVAREQDASEAETVAVRQDLHRRKGLAIEPIRTDFAEHNRETSRSGRDFLDDDEFMEELQTATVQEAKPMLVAKTPVSATFSASPTKGRATPGASAAPTVRTLSNPVRGNLIVPTDTSQSSARSVSTGAGYLQQVTQQQQQQQGGNLAKKTNIGSSISQRIKALEKLSAASGDTGAPAARERPSSTFFAVKKRESSKSPSVMERASSFRKQTPESAPQSHEPSPDAGKDALRGRAGSMTGRLSMFELPPLGANSSGLAYGNTQRGRPESVSVTAKIVRDPNENFKVGFEPAKDPSEYGRLELKQSPLLVDHQKATPEPNQAAGEAAPGSRSSSPEQARSGKARPSSLSIVKGFIKERRRSITSTQDDVLAAPAATNPSRSPSRGPSAPQNNSFSPRLSMGSRRSSLSSRDRDSAVSPTGESPGDDAKSANGDKKLSRAGRFMRRLSTLSGSRTKNSPAAMSPTVAEEESPDPAAERPATTGTPTIVSFMGDVNVQFPDTLLWKRRNMCLDSQGFVILSALPAQTSRQAQGTKRYHLSEFRTPYIPDVEVQELPNSVVLDFVDGTSIQVACEDRAGQVNVLSILQAAHATRGSTYGL